MRNLATKVGRRMARQAEAKRAFQKANKLWSQGQIRSAFGLFLAAAKAGVVPAFRTVGQFYDRGDGVRASQRHALYWYRRAYQHGSHSAANNIGCIWRERGNLNRAIWWLKRAVKQGDDDANLNIAKIYLGSSRQKEAISYLRKTCNSRQVTEGSKEEARLLLEALKDRRRGAL